MPSSTTLELHRDQAAPAQARDALASFREELTEERYQAAGLMLSELVTNAVKYGGRGSLQVELTSRPEVFRAEVVDDGTGFIAPERDTSDLATPGGWGLHLVAALSDRWGTYEGSTHVWFELRKGGRLAASQLG
jgi:anti-sigma regulatory factor (Ser/Thr protein kinase)